MRNQLLITTALLMTISTAAFADATTAPAAPPATQTTTPGHADGTGLRQDILTNLQHAGFTDVKVMPDSFLVQAKDKSGNPMTMFIGPDSVTEISAVKTAPSASSGGMFTSVPTTEDMSSKVIGLDVYNKANQDIGAIKDIAFDPHGVKAYIVGVGGFLGMGEHYVAVQPAALSVTYNANDKKWHAAIDTNSDQLKAAPEYKYPSTF